MKKFNRYIAKHMIFGIITAMTVLLAIEYIFYFAQEARMIGTGDYSLLDVLYGMLLSAPARIYQMFPASALLGTLMGLSILASRSELVAMHASGVSKAQIIKAVIRCGAVLAILAWCLGEMVGPVTERIAQTHRAYALSGGQAVQTDNGTWLRDGLDFIHVHQIRFSGELEGVTIYHFNEEMHLICAQFATKAHYENGVWTLQDVRQTEFSVMRLHTQKFASLEWDTKIKPELWQVIDTRHLEDLSLKGLWRNLEYRRSNGLDYAGYELTLWQKLMQPFQTLIMIFLATPFVFGPLRSASIGLKILTGILVGFSFHTLYEILTNMSLVVNIPASIGATLPLIGFALIGVFLLRKLE